MKMDDDERPDVNSDEEESDAGWYFDLPNGAWERQEAKNRELRQSLRRNMDAEPPKREAFGRDEARDGRPEGAPPSRRIAPGGTDDNEKTTPPGWILPSELHDEPEEADEAPVEYSSEPEQPAELPLKLRSRRLPEEDGAPALKPPPGLFSDGPSPLSAEPDDEAPVVPQAPRFARRAADEEEDARPFVRGDLPPAPPPAEHGSRWEEFFGEKASDGASMLDGMRAWAKSSDAQREDPVARDEPVAPAEPALDRAHESPAAPGLERDPGSPAPIPLRVQRHDEDEPPLVNTENPQSRWDQMFGRTAAEDSGLLDGMRAWATKPHDDDEVDSPPRMRLTDEPEEADENLFEPLDWERDSAAPREEAEPHETKGLLGKLFGKKKKASERLPAAGEAAWDTGDETPDGFPSRLSFGSSDDSDDGSWLGRSDGRENQFAAPGEPDAAWLPASSDTPAESPWRFEEDDVPPSRAVIDFGPAEEEPEWAPEVMPNEAPPTEPAPAMASTTWDLPREERGEAKSAWDPAEAADGWEPVTPAVAREPAAAAPPVPSAAPPATRGRPAADEDPWSGLDEAEREEAPLEAASRFTATGNAGPTAGTPTLPDETTAAPERDDPWAAFIAGREDADEQPRATAPAWSEVHPEADSEPPQDEPDVAPWAAIASGAAAGALAASAHAGADDAPDEADTPDSAFARVHDAQLEEAAPPAGDEAPPADDPWAAIAEASGVEPGSGEIAIFRGSAEVEDALQRYEAEREAEEAVEAIDPEAFPAAVESEMLPRAERPAWDDSPVEDDTVLRAFERHASQDDRDDQLSDMPPGSDTEPVVFDELLGEDADDIVAEASQQSPESRYFGRMHGWAPQRTTPGGRQVFPWEADTEEPGREEPVAPGEQEPVLEGWSRVEEPPPPWATTPAGDHGEAPSVRRKSRSRMLVREIVETGLLALLVFLAVRASFQNFKVDGLSMYPTLEDGEYLIVNKLAYAEVDMDRLGNFVPFVEAGDDPTREVFGGPERGDIVVLQDPREEDTDLIKRIIGLPGETLEIVDGEVYINDFRLDEPYIKQEWGGDKEKVLIPEGYYFVMGDNRSNSLDSRTEGPNGIGLIPKDLIIGKAALTYWPSSKFGLAPNESGDISEQDGRPTVTAQSLED